jgi:hypothetical protein
MFSAPHLLCLDFMQLSKIFAFSPACASAASRSHSDTSRLKFPLAWPSFNRLPGALAQPASNTIAANTSRDFMKSNCAEMSNFCVSTILVTPG